MTMIPVKVYTSDYCGYCRAAKTLLTHLRVPFEEIDCSGDSEVRKWLMEETGQRTVPQIFLADVPIGGYSELSELHRDGQLEPILRGELAPTSVK